MRGCALGVVAAYTLISAPSAAQINVEPFRARLKESGYTFRGRLGVTAREGNTRGVELGAGLLVGVSKDRSLAYLSLSGDYVRHNGVTQVAKSFGHLRYNYAFANWIAGEAFAQIESDRFRSLRARELLGLGPRVTLMEEENARIYYGTSVMLEFTQRNQDVIEEQRSSKAVRWNNYVTVTVDVHDRIALSQTAYYQPRFDNFRDFWLLSVSSAEFSVTQRLSSRLDLSVRREAIVPEGVKHLDGELVSSLELRF